MMKSSSLGGTVLAGSTIFGLTLSYLLANDRRARDGGTAGLDRRARTVLGRDFQPTQIATAPIKGVTNSEYKTVRLSACFDDGSSTFLRRVRVKGLDADAGDVYPFGLSVERDFVPIGWDEDRKTMEIAFNCATKLDPMARFLNSVKKGDGIETREASALLARQSLAGVKEIGFIVAGEGLAPALQYLRHLIRDGRVAENHTSSSIARVSILVSNRTPNSILGRDRLEEYTKSVPAEVLTVTHTFTRSSGTAPLTNNKRWRTESGRVDLAMIKRASMPAPALGNEARIVVCGAPGFVDAVTDMLRRDLGYEAEQVIGCATTTTARG